MKGPKQRGQQHHNETNWTRSNRRKWERVGIWWVWIRRRDCLQMRWEFMFLLVSKTRWTVTSENQIVNLAGMLFPPIGLFLILRLGIQHSQFLIRLAGIFMTPMSGINFIGARALLFMSVAQTHASWHSSVNGSVTQLILIKVRNKIINVSYYSWCCAK
jgi:hypothetical protein